MADPQELALLREVQTARDSRGRFGRFRGVVEDVNDPEPGLERVRVRVWAIHGPASRTPVDALPWADRSSESGGTVDSGSSHPLAVGASVYVEFEQGNELFPIVVGTFRGIPVANEANPQTVKSQDGLPYQPPDGQSERPGEVMGDRSTQARNPTVTVPFKSAKGAGLAIEDGDGREKMRLVDRAGQGLEFYAPTSKDANRGSGCNNGNAARRGTRTAFRGDQLPQEALSRRAGHTRLKDVAGQEVMLEGKVGKERVRIRSRNQGGTAESVLEMRSGRDRPGITLRDKAGGKLEMDPEGARGVSLEDATGNRMSLLPGGSMELASPTELRVNTGKDRVTEIGGSDRGTVQADDDKTILNNLKRVISGGVDIGAMGGAHVSLGGILQLLVTNAPQPGIPPSIPKQTDAAIDLCISMGGFKLKLPLGFFNIQALVGSITLECGNTLATDKVKLGGPTAAEPAVCGNIWVTLFYATLTALLAHTHTFAAGAVGPSPDLPGSLATVLAAIQAAMTDPTHQSPNDPLSASVVVEKLHVPTPV